MELISMINDDCDIIHQYVLDHVMSHYTTFNDSESYYSISGKFKIRDFSDLEGKVIEDIDIVSIDISEGCDNEYETVECIVIICEDDTVYTIIENMTSKNTGYINISQKFCEDSMYVIFDRMRGREIEKAIITGNQRHDRSTYALRVKGLEGLIYLGDKSYNSDGLIFAEFKHKRKIKIKKLK